MNKIKSYLIAIVISVFIINSCAQDKSIDLNLGFEKMDLKTKNPFNWYIDKDLDYNISLDSSIVYKGKYALKIDNIGKFTPKGQARGGSILIDNIHAKRSIKLSGYIKAENTNSDSLGLFINVPDENIIKISKNINLARTHNWKEYTIELKLHKDLESFYIGVCLLKDGKIWVDDLKLYIDGKQISNIPHPEFVASNLEIKWLKKHSTEIKKPNPKDEFDDLLPLEKMIGEARIVGLGEFSHGTSEVMKMKQRMFEFLVTKMGFSIFSIEASMPEVYKLNDYVLYGKGDPAVLLREMKDWLWNTQEMLDLIEWMRKFNASGKGKIQFTGFDMEFIIGAIENLNKFAEKHDRILKSKLDELTVLVEKLQSKGAQIFESIDEFVLIKSQCEKILSYISNNKYVKSTTMDESDRKWLIQNANILVQNFELGCKIANGGPNNMGGVSFRDECMAKNINWIIENNHNAKIVLCAHNVHISKQRDWMGSFLSEKFGASYYNIAFLSNSGTYTAKKPTFRLSSDNMLHEGKPGSFEYSFHKTGMQCFFFDFSQVNEKEPESQWLTYNLRYHSIGADAVENDQFQKARISKLYNAIIYIDSTHASHCFSAY